MRRWSTALIVVGVAALAVFAAADALRGDGQPKGGASVPATTRERPPTLRETLRRQGVSGQILYSGQDCILHSLVLPQMVDDVVRRDNGAGAFHDCRFSVAAGRLRDDDELMSPDGQLIARCRAGHVEVFIASGERRLSRVPGCAPAWRPDNGLTYARSEVLYENGRRVLTRADLHRAARRHPNVADLSAGVPFRVRVIDLAWLGQSELLASLEIRIQYVEYQYLAVLFQGKAIVGITTNFNQTLRRWVVSPEGSFAAAEDGTIMARDGGSVELPDGLPTGRAVAFSPDERWLAYVTGASIYLIGTPRNSEPGRVIRLPIAAQDLAWEPGGPTIDTTTTAR